MNSVVGTVDVPFQMQNVLTYDPYGKGDLAPLTKTSPYILSVALSLPEGVRKGKCGS